MMEKGSEVAISNLHENPRTEARNLKRIKKSYIMMSRVVLAIEPVRWKSADQTRKIPGHSIHSKNRSIQRRQRQLLVIRKVE